MSASKYNFIISNYQKLWIKKAKNLFITEPYVYHVLKKNNELKKFSSIRAIPYRHQSKVDLIEDSKFVDKKYEKYISILSKRLDEIHDSRHKSDFWKKSLSMAFIRYITTFYDIYKKCEIHFNVKEYDCNILSEKSYYIPYDFEEHRDRFQNSDLGIEQIFSIYIKLYYPEIFKEVDVFEQNMVAISENESMISRRDNLIRISRKYLKKIAKLTPQKVYLKIRSIIKYRAKCNIKEIQIGICGTCFSQKNLNTLINKSNYRIFPIVLDVKKNISVNSIDWQKREFLASEEKDFDNFDKFFFTSLKYCFPKVFVENFKDIEKNCEKFFKPYKKLKYIVSEIWISNTLLSIYLAINQAKEIKHITNEHNALTYPYVGSYIQHVAELSDIFVSLGWYDPEIKNMLKGASLFPYNAGIMLKKQYKILYVSCVSPVKMAHYVSHYGTDEENSHRHLDFVSSYMRNLKKNTLKELTYRAYPETSIKLLAYDKEYFLRRYLKNIGSLSDTTESATTQMRRAGLVIIDYVSTSHLESLSMNIPTVFFWNPDSYYLRDEYSDFFKSLLDVGICQSDPVKAAQFVESIKDDPDKWWFSEETQKGKNEFLKKNIGDPEIMINYLLSLVN